MRPYNRWTPAEISLFRELRAQGLNVPQLARKLNRTVGSIQGRMAREILGTSPSSQQPALIRFLLESPKTRDQILAAGFTPTPLKNLVTRGHVVGRTFRGFGSARTYEVTNEGKRNLDSRYPNPYGPTKNGPRKHSRAS